ncbi:MAG: c-type cytochrome [Myxococcales bacterium]|nr:c-type cytochrome [Myxococcales bacterium]
MTGRKWISRVVLSCGTAFGLLWGVWSCGVTIEEGEELAGGGTSVLEESRDAYSRSARNMSADLIGDFTLGNSFFNTNWTTAPASASARDGLGPTFNARSCSGCHFKDGRGRPPEPGKLMTSMLVRLSVPGVDEHGGPKPDPNYGGQLNTASIQDVPAEGFATVEYEEIKGQFADGTPYTLRKPKIVIKDLAYGPLSKDIMLSPRVAPPVYGLGLLEAIPEEAILAQADPDDKDGDGISGRPNWVWDVVHKKKSLGRFGWKANQPSLMQQNAGAFLGDIGITSPLFPSQNCPDSQKACLSAIQGGEPAPNDPELTQRRLDQVTFYTRALAVPMRRKLEDPQVLRGKALFAEAKCGSCHTPKWTTGEVSDASFLSKQTIWPYTDLLLHDMGKELADNRPDYEASGQEWRTPPLWGMGLTKIVNDHTMYMHDGRARDVQEAILWHGGEGTASRDAFVKMSKEDRDALVAFINSL